MTTPRGSGQTVSATGRPTRYSLENKKRIITIRMCMRVIEVVFYIKYDQQENLHQV